MEQSRQIFRYWFPHWRSDARAEVSQSEIRDADENGIAIPSEIVSVLHLCNGIREIEEILDTAQITEAEARSRIKAILLAMRDKGNIHDGAPPFFYVTEMENDLNFLENLTYSCSSCGRCCQIHSIGPVSQAYVNFIMSQPSITQHPKLKGKTLFVRTMHPRTGNHIKLYEIAYNDEYCVFLDGKRCLIHSVLGFAAKPGLCRAFPYFHMNFGNNRNFNGLRMDCQELFKGMREGKRLAESGHSIKLALWNSHAERTYLDDRVALTHQLKVHFKTYKRLEKWMLHRVDGSKNSIPKIIPELVDVLLSMEKIESCESVMTSFLADLASSKPRPLDAFWHSFKTGYAPLLANLSGIINDYLIYVKKMRKIVTPHHGGPLWMQEHACHAIALFKETWEKMGPEDFLETTFLEETESDFRKLLEQFIHAKEFLSFGNLANGLLSFLFSYFIARVVTQRYAMLDNMDSPTSQHASWALAVWSCFVWGICNEENEQILLKMMGTHASNLQVASH